MATRATYSFDTPHAGKVTFYIHHDGYPEGAAAYFYKLLEFKPVDEMEGRRVEANSLYNLAERFLRVNENAQFTTSHGAHSDTEFRYSVNSVGVVKVEKRIRQFQGEKIEWLAIFKGPIVAFVSEYMQSDEQPAAVQANAAIAKAAKPAQSAKDRLAAAMAAAAA